MLRMPERITSSPARSTRSNRSAFRQAERSCRQAPAPPTRWPRSAARSPSRRDRRSLRRSSCAASFGPPSQSTLKMPRARRPPSPLANRARRRPASPTKSTSAIAASSSNRVAQTGGREHDRLSVTFVTSEDAALRRHGVAFARDDANVSAQAVVRAVAP